MIAGITYHWFILIFLAALYSPNGGTGHHRHGGTKRILTNLAIEHTCRDVQSQLFSTILSAYQWSGTQQVTASSMLITSYEYTY